MKKLAILGALLIGMGSAGAVVAGVTVSTSLSGPAAVMVGEEAAWDITITATTDQDVTGVIVKDGFGADLDEIVVGIPDYGTAVAGKMGKGKMGATVLTWEVGDMAAGSTATIVVTVTTGYNPTEKHEFTTAELLHELDGGASARYFFEGVEYQSLETMPLTVDVLEPVE